MLLLLEKATSIFVSLKSNIRLAKQKACLIHYYLFPIPFSLTHRRKFLINLFLLILNFPFATRLFSPETSQASTDAVHPRSSYFDLSEKTDSELLFSVSLKRLIRLVSQS